uniref:BED-type domain-containing protein n=1 Tax=Meloidogyne hapla TaxID=6305 RepID=A0A1I8C1P5_MELHA
MGHPIWQIGLFDKREKDIVECLECNQMLKLSAGSIKGIKTHLFSKHKDSKYTEQYSRIEEGKSKQANTKITNYYTHFSELISRLLIISTFLDPRFKHCYSDDRNIYFAKVSRYLREEVNEEIQSDFLEEPSSPCHKQPRSFLEMMDDAACSSKQVVSSERKGIDYELREYEEGDRAQISLDPLHWWQGNEKNFR